MNASVNDLKIFQLTRERGRERESRQQAASTAAGIQRREAEWGGVDMRPRVCVCALRAGVRQSGRGLVHRTYTHEQGSTSRVAPRPQPRPPIAVLPRPSRGRGAATVCNFTKSNDTLSLAAERAGRDLRNLSVIVAEIYFYLRYVCVCHV